MQHVEIQADRLYITKTTDEGYPQIWILDHIHAYAVVLFLAAFVIGLVTLSVSMLLVWVLGVLIAASAVKYTRVVVHPDSTLVETSIAGFVTKRAVISIPWDTVVVKDNRRILTFQTVHYGEGHFVAAHPRGVIDWITAQQQSFSQG